MTDVDDTADVFDAILGEFERIGLRPEDLPGFAMDVGADHALLELLRRLPVGATWRDVFPDMPADRVPERSET